MDENTPVTPENDSMIESEDQEVAQEENQEEQGAAQAKTPSQKKNAEKLTEEELEEIALGSVKGRVPKALAKAIKDYERGVQTKFQEVSQVKKQAQELVNFARQNPKEFFKQLQIDPYEFAESTLAEKLELMQMSPEQKKLMEYEERLKKYTEIEEREKKTKEEEKRNQETSQAQQNLDKEITEAFSTSGLPKHPFYVQQIAASMLSAEKRGEPLSARDATARVKERFNTHVKEIFSSLDAADIQALLGDGVLKKLREAEIKRVTGQSAPTLKSAQRPGGSAPVTQSTQSKTKYMNEREWKAWQASLKNGG